MKSRDEVDLISKRLYEQYVNECQPSDGLDFAKINRMMMSRIFNTMSVSIGFDNAKKLINDAVRDFESSNTKK